MQIKAIHNNKIEDKNEVIIIQFISGDKPIAIFIDSDNNIDWSYINGSGSKLTFRVKDVNNV